MEFTQLKSAWSFASNNWILFKVSAVSTIAVSVALANISLPFTCWHHKNIQICHPCPHLWDKFSILKLYFISSQGFTIWEGIKIDSTVVWQGNYQIQSSCCNFNILVYWSFTGLSLLGGLWVTVTVATPRYQINTPPYHLVSYWKKLYFFTQLFPRPIPCTI